MNWQFWKPSIDTQRSWVITQKREILDIDLPLGKGCLESNNTHEAWYLIPRWLVYVEEFDDYVQIIDERNGIPVPLGVYFGYDKEEDVRALTNLSPIAKERLRDAKRQASEGALKNKFFMNAMVISGLVMACLIAIIALVFLFQSGKIHIPGLGG